MKKVIIASLNPVKIEAVQNGFKSMFNEDFEFEGISVPSNVSEQPKTSDETLLGANNRATNAMKERPDADFWVGLEGGVENSSYGMKSLSWVVVKSKDKTGIGEPGVFILPQKVAELINGGMDLGQADDVVFNRSNSKQAEGAVGLLTKKLITRPMQFQRGVEFALIPFINPELY